MLNLFRNRKTHIIIAFILIFTFLGFSLYDLTITQGDELYKKSISNRIKKIETLAKRGDIYDRNGELLATSEIGRAHV